MTNSNKKADLKTKDPPLPLLEEGAGGRRPKIVIIKYNSGNIRSVLYALERIGYSAIVTDDADEIKSADKVIFPGVGEAGSAMKYLKERNLDKVIVSLKQPVLGICLGMQLMCKYSEENDTECLGIFEEEVKKFGVGSQESGVRSPKFKIPQIGWNSIQDLKTDLFKNVADKSYCYFVHGYYVPDNPWSIGTTDYIQPYCSAMQRDNFFGIQFHPEKSAAAGEQILKNFLSL